jgi:hypothetical protein
MTAADYISVTAALIAIISLLYGIDAHARMTNLESRIEWLRLTRKQAEDKRKSG